MHLKCAKAQIRAIVAKADDQQQQDMHLKCAEAQIRAIVAKAAACLDIQSSPEAFSMHGPPPGLHLGAPPGLDDSKVKTCRKQKFAFLSAQQADTAKEHIAWAFPITSTQHSWTPPQERPASGVSMYMPPPPGLL
jgi:hypothetical protein